MATKFEYKLHQLFLKANPTLTTSNVKPRVARKLYDLKHEGIIESFDYYRDNNNELITVIFVGSEPTQISTFKDRMNKLYLQEKMWSQIK